MTINEIIKDVKWVDVKRSLDYFYPENRNNHEKVFKFLKSIKKKKHKDPDEVIEIKTWGGEIGMLPEDIYYSVHTNKYSLSFRKWAEVANIPIGYSTLNHYKREEIIAHFIWEITFYGSEKQMEKKGKELLKKVKEIKKNGKK